MWTNPRSAYVGTQCPASLACPIPVQIRSVTPCLFLHVFIYLDTHHDRNNLQEQVTRLMSESPTPHFLFYFRIESLVDTRTSQALVSQVPQETLATLPNS